MGNSLQSGLCACVTSDEGLDALFEEYDVGPPPRLSFVRRCSEEVPYLFPTESEVNTPLSLEEESAPPSLVSVRTRLRIDVDESGHWHHQRLLTNEIFCYKIRYMLQQW